MGTAVYMLLEKHVPYYDWSGKFFLLSLRREALPRVNNH